MLPMATISYQAGLVCPPYIHSPVFFPGGRRADPYRLHPWVSLTIYLSVRLSQKEALEDWRTGYKRGGTLVLPLSLPGQF